jgi:hypothetical protein
MTRLNLLFYGLSIFLVVACKNKDSKNVNSEYFDTHSFLELRNTNERVFRNTKTYKEILNSFDNIIVESIIPSNFLIEDVGMGFDSTFFSQINDTLIISNVKGLMGKCDPEYVSKIEFIGKDAYLLNPEVIIGEVNILNKDTTISVVSCELISVFEFKYKIPTSKLENIEHLYFKGQEIDFKRK